MDAAAEAVVRRLDKTLGIMLAEGPSLTAGMMRMFLNAALREGANQTDLINLTGISRPTASRQLLDLGETKRDGTPGLNWLDRGTSYGSLREVRYSLTPQGRDIIDRVVKTWD